MSSSIPQKQCRICKQFFPATPEFFYNYKYSKDGLYNACKPCRREEKRQAYRDNPEQHKAINKRNYDKHKEIRKATQRDYNKTPKGKESSRRNYDKHRDDKLSQKKDYVKNNPLKLRIHWRKMRHMRRTAEGQYDQNDLNVLYEEQNGKCGYCGISIYWEIPKDIHIDHIIPVSKGGTNWPDNLTLTCQHCNQTKHNKTLQEWVGSRGW